MLSLAGGVGQTEILNLIRNIVALKDVGTRAIRAVGAHRGVGSESVAPASSVHFALSLAVTVIITGGLSQLGAKVNGIWAVNSQVCADEYRTIGRTRILLAINHYFNISPIANGGIAGAPIIT